MIHDPAIFYDEVSGNYYTYSTGAICQKSKDLVHWQEIGKVHGDFFGKIKPAATMVEIKALVNPEMLIEIEATAWIA